MSLPLPRSADPRESPDDPRRTYVARLATRRDSLAAGDRDHRLAGNLRMVSFLVLLALVVTALVRDTVAAWWFVVPVILLVGLGAGLRRLEARRLKLSRAVEFYVRGLNRLDGRW